MKTKSQLAKQRAILAISVALMQLDGKIDKAAVLQRETAHCLEGSSYESTRRAQKRQSAKYRGDYRIWMSYAGDYKSK